MVLVMYRAVFSHGFLIMWANLVWVVRRGIYHVALLVTIDGVVL